jgi:hypothetical protein
MASKAQIRQFDGDGAPARGDRADPDVVRLRWLTLWFYVGVPLALGFLLGWLQVGRASEWPRYVSLLYWLGVAHLTTPLNALGTALLAPLLRRLHSPLWLTLFLGQVLAGFLFTNPLLQAYRGWLRATVYPDLVLTQAPTLAEFMQRLPSNSVLWVGICLLFFYGLRMPLFGYRPLPREQPLPEPLPAAMPGRFAAPAAGATAVTIEAARPTRLALMERMRPERRGTLLAVKAEGHYLQVYTSAGSELILYRLSDAMLELSGEDGAQVHRSWWVAACALAPQRHRDRLVLVNGLEVPVSRSFRVAARQRGWLNGTDSRDDPHEE